MEIESQIVFKNSKIVTVEMGQTNPNQRVYFQPDGFLSSKIITGIQWLKGGVDIPASSYIGGILKNVIASQQFTLSLIDDNGTVIWDNFILDSLAKSTNSGKIRKTFNKIKLNNCFVLNISVGSSIIGDSILAFEFYYQ